MKKIEAIIQPHKIEDVKEALKKIGIDGMTITEVRGHGRQKGHKEVYRGMEYQVDLLPKVKLELVVPSARLDEITKTLADAARTGVRDRRVAPGRRRHLHAARVGLPARHGDGPFRLYARGVSLRRAAPWRDRAGIRPPECHSLRHAEHSGCHRERTHRNMYL